MIFEFFKNIGYKEMSLGVGAEISGAMRFYHKLGFEEIF